jgi:cytochrome c
MTFVRVWIAMLATVIAALSGAVHAQERGTAAEAKAMAEKAIAHIKAVGKEKAFVEFTTKGGSWHHKDLYVFAIDMEGNTLGHGGNPALVGKNISALKDPNGKAFVAEFGELAKGKGSGWVDYMFLDPQSKKTLPKQSYIIRFPDGSGYVGVGIYKQ